MASDRDPFDVEALRIDPADPTFVPRGVVGSKKKKWKRKFVRVPWTWLDRLKATNCASTYKLALFLIYEHWRNGGRAIRLANAALAEVGVSRRTKGPALRELERFELIKVDRHLRKSPLVTLLVDPRTGDQ
jgi:hypothetical protein